ncbi:MAG TPA: hypothetical protein VKI01_10870 [Acidimicrobiia bacterium]|nr:hypothetical protein [Acidimicrobiia bacterium]
MDTRELDPAAPAGFHISDTPAWGHFVNVEHLVMRRFGRVLRVPAGR